MPTPQPNETEGDFMERCIPMVLDEGTAADQEQAVAVCMSMYREGKQQPRQREYKALPIAIDGIEGRTVKSLFSVAGRVDDGDDRVIHGAFKKTLAENLHRVKALWQHDMSAPPVGVVRELREIGGAELSAEYKQRFPDATGALYGEIEYLDTDRGNEILAGIRAGAITENSIGYDVIQADYTTDGGRKVRQLKELRLWDVSPVNWGMQPAAVNLKSAISEYAAPGVDLGELATRLQHAFGAKEGRVLSGRNLERLRAALATLNELLTSAEPPEDPEEGMKALTALRRRLAIAETELI